MTDTTNPVLASGLSKLGIPADHAAILAYNPATADAAGFFALLYRAALDNALEAQRSAWAHHDREPAIDYSDPAWIWNNEHLEWSEEWNRLFAALSDALADLHVFRDQYEALKAPAA